MTLGHLTFDNIFFWQNVTVSLLNQPTLFYTLDRCNLAAARLTPANQEPQGTTVSQ